MTLTELLADCYRRLDFPTSPSSVISTRMTAFLNEVQQELLSEPGMGSLLNGSLTFSSVASTPQYSIPQAVARIHAIYETTNDNKLDGRSLDWYRTVYPDVATVTGTPDTFVDLGFTSIATQPSAATEIFVDSTAAGDTGTAYVEGYRTGGYFKSASVTMTGATGVSLSATTTDWIYITKFYLSTAAVGTVTLQTTAAGGTTLATIPIGQTTHRGRRIALAPTPASAITYTIDFDWDAQNMANGTDEPLLPLRFHRLLATGARMREYEKAADMERYVVAKREFEEGKRKLKHFIYTNASAVPNLRGYGSRKASQLGPYFPSGS